MKSQMSDAKERLKKIVEKDRREENESSIPKPPSRPTESTLRSHGVLSVDDVDNPFRDNTSTPCINLEEDDLQDIHTITTLLPSPPSESAVSGCECNYCTVS